MPKRRLENESLADVVAALQRQMRMNRQGLLPDGFAYEKRGGQLFIKNLASGSLTLVAS